MKDYSIVRVGNDYVVQAGDECVLKIASRRRAAKLVTEAAELLDALLASPLAEAPTVSLIADDFPGVRDTPVIPDP
jgi:hypothetical protein